MRWRMTTIRGRARPAAVSVARSVSRCLRAEGRADLPLPILPEDAHPRRRLRLLCAIRPEDHQRAHAALVSFLTGNETGVLPQMRQFAVLGADARHPYLD